MILKPYEIPIKTCYTVRYRSLFTTCSIVDISRYIKNICINCNINVLLVTPYYMYFNCIVHHLQHGIVLNASEKKIADIKSK